MLTRTRFAFVAVLAAGGMVIAGQALAASKKHHAPARSNQFVDRPVALPYYGGTGESFYRYSGPFRTDASPNSGGS